MGEKNNYRLIKKGGGHCCTLLAIGSSI